MKKFFSFVLIFVCMLTSISISAENISYSTLSQLKSYSPENIDKTAGYGIEYNNINLDEYQITEEQLKYMLDFFTDKNLFFSNNQEWVNQTDASSDSLDIITTDYNHYIFQFDSKKVYANCTAYISLCYNRDKSRKPC